MGNVVPLRPVAAAGFCPTCAPFGDPGWMPVTVRPHTAGNPYDEPLTTLRPCQECRPDQFGRWRTGRLRAKPDAKQPARSRDGVNPSSKPKGANP